MNAPVRIQSPDRQIWFNELPAKLSEAVARYPLPETADWAVLDELSSATVFEGVDAYGASAVIDGEQLVAPGNVYVKLQYDPGSADAVVLSERFPARIFFSVSTDKKTQEKNVSVEHIDIDVSPFFG